MYHVAFEYLTAVISLFAQNDLRLSEQEVNIILIPLLNCQLQSLTVYKDSVIYRAASDSIHLIRQVYPPSLLMDMLVKYMHQCSTAKMRQSKLCLFCFVLSLSVTTIPIHRILK